METLHLSYYEVLDKIPYRNLIIMQKDKMHPVYGKKKEVISGKDMAKRRRKN